MRRAQRDIGSSGRNRSAHQAASTSSQRTGADPAFVIEVIRLRDELESSPGAKPRYDATWWPSVKRSQRSSAAAKRSAVCGPTPGADISRTQTSLLCAIATMSASAALICSLSASIATNCRSTNVGRRWPRLAKSSRSLRGSVLRGTRGRNSWVRSQPRTELVHLVREETSASLRPQTVLTSRDQEEGTCTEGKSMRQETALSAWASRRSVFVRRAPTPRERTSVDGTT